MTEQTCLVAVDVGNSAVKLCVRRDASTQDIGSELIDFSVPIQQDDWQRTAIRWVQDHVGCRRSRWRIASVQRSAAKSLQDAVIKMNHASQSDVSVDFVSRRDVPMKAKVDQPDRLGIDRLLSAFAAHNQFACPLTVVDAGSAVTIDWVNSAGEFCGGAILPGLQMQAASLAKGTDALPQIDWHNAEPDPQTKCDEPSAVDGGVSSLSSRRNHGSAATNTVAAIRLGLMTGVTAAIDRLSQFYASTEKDASLAIDPARLVLTGGDASAISPYVEQPHVIVPNLVCRGLLDLAKL